MGQFRGDEPAGLVKIHNRTRSIDLMLPGILQSLSIDGEVLIENQSSEGGSASQKIVRGWGDKTVSLSYLLLDDEKETGETANQKLTRLEKLFMKHRDGVPDIYTLTNEHIQARNVSEVIFGKLSSSRSLGKCAVSLSFCEYLAPQGVNNTAGSGGSNDSNSNDNSNSNTNDSDDFVKEQENMWTQGFKKSMNMLGVEDPP